MKTTKQKKKDFMNLIKGLRKQGLELIENGHEFGCDHSRKLNEKIITGTERNFNIFEPSGEEIILIGICPKYYCGIISEAFQELGAEFRDK